MPLPCAPLFRLSMLALLTLATGSATGAANLGGGFGLGYLYPRSGEISDPYGGGLSFHLLGEISDLYGGTQSCRLPGGLSLRLPAVSVGVELGYHRGTARLGGPMYVSAAEGTLHQVPVELIARLHPARGPNLRPHAGLGLLALWTREEFHYRLLGEPRERSPKEFIRPGMVLVVGLQRAAPPRFRLEGYMSFVPVKRRVSLGNTDYETPGAASYDAGSLGVRIAWRLP